jgi:AcrR family transcriptional regulator
MSERKPTERVAQKARTREALLAAARDILAEGGTPTVTGAAARAGISKATAYRYFSDPSELVAEAGLAVAVLPYEEIVADAVTVRQKLRAISAYIFDLSVTHEAGFRQFLARNLDAWLADPRPRTRRGARRVPMFDRALDSHAAEIPAETRRQLVLSLSAATGVEAMIALFDIAEVDPETARKTVLDICDALIDRHLGPDTR